MTERGVRDYLSKLTNSDVEPDTVIMLTSGQRARFLSWIGQDAAFFREVKEIIGHGFTIGQLPMLSASTADPGNVESNPLRASETERRTPLPRLMGMGIDIQRIVEIVSQDNAFDFKSSQEYATIFSQREISYACAKDAPAQTLAGLFAAKEAIMKADQAMSSKQLSQIEILPDASGAPTHDGFQLSISHSGEYAIAIAIKVAG